MSESKFNEHIEQQKNHKKLNNTPNHINKSKVKKYNKFKLPTHFYENLFMNEMEFKIKPQKELILKIIQKYCSAIEYFFSIGDDIGINKFRVLLKVFLFDPKVVSFLEDDNSLKNSVKSINLKNELIIQDNVEQFDQNFDSNSKILKLNQLNNENDYNIKNIIHTGNTEMKRKNTMNILINEIEIQENNFKKKLFLKKVKKNNNQDSTKEQIKKSIQNTSIMNKNTDNKENEDQNQSSISQISPIRTNENSFSNSNKINISNEEVSSFLDSAKNNNNNSSNKQKDTPSRFEPFTPINSDKNDSNENYKKNKNETVHDFNENFELNFDLNEKNKSNKNLSPKNEILINNNEIREIGNGSNNSFSTNSNSLNDSLNKKQIFNLDYQNIFEIIENCKSIGIKQQKCFNDIKDFINNFIKDFNSYFYDELFVKFLLQISNINDKKYENFVKVYEYYSKQIKDAENEIFEFKGNDEQIKEYTAIIESLKNELDNEVGKIDNYYNKTINDLVIVFKNNYNKNDAGIKLMEEKFKLNICNKLSEILSCDKK